MDAPSTLTDLVTNPGGARVAEAPVMVLPSTTLFPQALFPLYIFEPRYRQMLDDALATHRMFVVAMRKPGSSRETPASIAGLGLIRFCMRNDDGTSQVILQGVTRVELTGLVRYRPYRVHRVRALRAPNRDSVTIDALLAKVRDLVSERIELGLPPSFPPAKLKEKSKKSIIAYLDDISDPDRMADLVSCFLLPAAVQRQTILETVEVESRLKHLIHFLMAEITLRRRKKKKQ